MIIRSKAPLRPELVRTTLVAIFLLAVFPGSLASQTIDSSPLFNKCIKERKTIYLQKGNTYYLKSKIEAGEYINIVGNGATIVIPATYPLRRYDNIFSLKDSGKIVVENVNIDCYLGQKFAKRDSLGDTYIFYASRGDIKMKDVKFNSSEHYNNVTFITSNGANVSMEKCKIVTTPGLSRVAYSGI